MTQRDVPGSLFLTEAQFREVIERATRAENRDGISVDQLRQVASELDIDPAALQRALVEVVSAGQPTAAQTPPPVKSSGFGIGRLLQDMLPRRGRAALGAIIGGSLGWFSAYVALTVNTGANAFIDVPVSIALILITLANSVARRVEGEAGRFAVDTVAMWATFALAWSMTSGRVTTDLLTFVSVCLAGAAAWGWFFVRRNGPGKPTIDGTIHQAADETDTSTSDSASPNHVRYMLRPV